MKYSERHNFLYDQALFKRYDTQTALKIHHEYILKHSGKDSEGRYPIFMEVDRDNAVDHLWHTPKDGVTKFHRTIEIPAINQHQKPDWRLTKLGEQPKKRDNFWISNISLQEADYFPTRGDIVYFDGYRLIILKVVIPPENLWQQTNVWLGLYVETEIQITGDNLPPENPGKITPVEKSSEPRLQL